MGEPMPDPREEVQPDTWLTLYTGMLEVSRRQVEIMAQLVARMDALESAMQGMRKIAQQAADALDVQTKAAAAAAEREERRDARLVSLVDRLWASPVATTIGGVLAGGLAAWLSQRLGVDVGTVAP